jgi:hypothetical protein
MRAEGYAWSGLASPTLQWHERPGVGAARFFFLVWVGDRSAPVASAGRIATTARRDDGATPGRLRRQDSLADDQMMAATRYHRLGIAK